MSTQWDGSVSAEGKTDRERELRTELAKLITEMDREQGIAYCARVDGWVDRWQEKIDVAKGILDA